MLNLFQHPCAVIRTRSDARVAAGRVWVLKQVQDDDAILASFSVQLLAVETDPRRISVDRNSDGSCTSSSPSSSSIPAISFSAAERAIEALGQRTVVSGGQTWAAIGVSSKPMIDRSRGISSPR